MLISPAYAQDMSSFFSSGAGQFLPLVLIFAVFYFLLIRPQTQKQKETKAMLAALKRGDRVVTGAPVTEIAWDEAGVVARAGHTEVRARRAVLAVPPPLAARVRFEPGLPAERDKLTQRMPMGWTIKVNVVYDEPFWRADGLAGQANSDVRPLGTVFDNTPPAGRPGVLVGFLEGAHAGAAAGTSSAPTTGDAS